MSTRDEAFHAETTRLMDEGFDALRDGRLDDALAVATKLRERRHSSSFEIEARSRWERGEREEAINVLEQGVARVPHASPLWHWLACYRSDVGRYDGALEAFAREAEFEEVSASGNAYNVAVVYERMGRPREGLDMLDRVEAPDDPSPARFAELRARLFFDTGELTRSIDAATEAIKRIEESDGEPDWEVLTGAFAVRADAKLRSGDGAGALEDVAEAIDMGPSLAPWRALDVLRRIDARPAKGSREWTLLLEGALPEAENPAHRGFFVNMTVVADDAAEGLEFARRFVPDAARADLKISEVTDRGPATESWKGVYGCGPLHVFDPAAVEEDDTP